MRRTVNRGYLSQFLDSVPSRRELDAGQEKRLRMVLIGENIAERGERRSWVTMIKVAAQREAHDKRPHTAQSRE